MPLPLLAAAIPAIAGALGQAASGPNLSGVQGDYHAGGITVGSKVVGSGSASTSIPNVTSSGGVPLAVQPDGNIGVGSGASLFSQPWFPVAVGGALLALLLLFDRRKK